MSYAATLSWPTQVPEDRSLGTEAGVLRELLDEAAPLASDDKGSEIISRLFEALAQAANRDGTTVSFSAFTKTLEFMRSLPSELPLPIVVVESKDEMGLDWDEDDQRVVSLTIDSSDDVGFSALFGREPLYGKVECVDGLPETLRYVLARLYPTAQRG